MTQQATTKCIRCGAEKPSSIRFFVVEKKSRSGFRAVCRTCRNTELSVKRKLVRKKQAATSKPAAPAAPLPSQDATSKPRLVVVLSDVHYETRWKPLWDGLLAWAADFGSDVDVLVLNGDFVDFESASQHGGNPRPPTVKEDLLEAVQGLKELTKAFPKASRVYLEGNHEDRLRRYLVSNAPTFDGVFSIQDLLSLEATGWRYVELAKQPAHSTFGSLRLIHGCQLRGSGGVVVANTLLNKWWSSPGKTVACGHFHRYSRAARQAVEGNLSAISLPTMIEPAPAYTGGAHDHWDYGFVVFELLDGHVRHEPVIADSRGQFLYRGRVYGGKP